MTAGRGHRVPFDEINEAALSALPSLLRRWLPDGRIEGREWVALNPHRADSRRGSFKVNIVTSKWADFAIGARGGDVVSLAAYLHRVDRVEAAKRLAGMLGISLVTSNTTNTSSNYSNSITRKGPRR